MKPPIAVALSGGVDSLVAAHLLSRQGRRVIGLHFLTGFETDPAGADPGDCGKRDAERRLAPIAAQLQIPITVVDLSAEFKKRVVDYFIATYGSGRTPNPCLVCNPAIKFDLLAGCARELGADALATGHYARRNQDDQGQWQLLKGADTGKDQSYFLARLTQEQLAFARFPLAELRKSETIALAEQNNLHPISRKESQDICFIKNGDYSEFLGQQPGFRTAPGPIEDIDGKRIGMHNGLHRFTIGQRKGINCPAAEPYYVVRIEAERNCLVVGFKDALGDGECRVQGINWITSVPTRPFQAHVRVRYRHKAVPALVTPHGGTEAVVRFEVPEKAITPGQGAVFYQMDQVLGGGWIAGTPS